MTTIKAESLDSLDSYKLLVGSIQPRPIALVSTVDMGGRSNVAPFSFFSVASVFPPILSFAPQMTPVPGLDRGVPKHTLENLRDTGQCVIHITSYDQRMDMNETAAPWPKDVSEFDVSAWTPVPSDCVAPPRAAEAPVAFECELEQIISFGDLPRSGALALVRIIVAHVADDVFTDGKIDQVMLDTVGRMGGPVYTRTKESLFELAQPGMDHVRTRMESGL